MKLSTEQRKKIPASDYGLPAKKGNANTGKYPMPDKSHAKVAKAYASKEGRIGKLSKSQEDKIDSKADSVLGLRGKLAGLKPK